MKILVISLAGIGDTLLGTPLLRELRENFPEAVIDVLVRWPGAGELLENNPRVNRVHQKDLAGVGKGEAWRFLQTLRRERYDVSINTHPQSQRLYRLVARVVGAPKRISHVYECSGWLDRWLVNETLPQDYARHSIENNFDVLPLLGARKKLASHELEIFLTPEQEKWAEEFLAANKFMGRKILGVHLGSGGTKNLSLKRWPLAHYVALLQRLGRERPDIQVLLFGGPQEIEAHRLVLAQGNRDLVGEAKAENFRQTAALLKRCSAFLSVDTVLMHLAATVKVPNQIVIEAPTLNATNLPYGNPFTLVKNPVVAGRHLEYYRYDGGDIKGTREELLACMASIKVEDVFETVKRLI